MESSRKRKAAAATPSSADGIASKKLRLLNSHPAPAPKNNIQEVGQRIIEQLKTQTDKTGRYIATEFLELPDPDELPEYYEIIKLPIALDTIENKLKRNEYPTITSIEGDFKRMVHNAKEFNDPDSVIFEDAERIRKLVFNYMKQNNPAYKEDPRYTAVPTPLPEEKAQKPVQNGIRKVETEEAETDSRQPSEKPKRATTEQSDRKSSLAPSGGSEDGQGDVDLDLTGKTFQEAQQMIISHLLRYTDDEGLEIYSPFGNLPTRKLEDYYKVIRHPVSLKSVAKLCRGQHGRAPPSGQTDFKTWDMFEEEVSFIWRNAKDYNEDESDMYNLAVDFEEHFKTLLADAKEKVEEPSGPRLKIGGPKPKVMLNLAQHRASPAPGVTVDNEALARQRQLVQAGANGRQTSHPPVNGAVQPMSQVPVDGIRPSSSARSGSPMGTAIKTEKTSTQSPAPVNSLPAGYPLTNGMMPPPAVRPMSGSPYPGQLATNTFQYTTPAFLPPTQLRSYPKEAALLPTVTISSHPNLKVSNPFSMSVTPHATLSHQSTTTTLPNSHYFLQISATISKQLSMGRPYKIFVSVNGTRLTQRDTLFHPDSNKRTHVYEGSLAQGVNRIEVEVAAAKEKETEKDEDGEGTGTAGAGKGLDVEKVTVFANLMR